LSVPLPFRVHSFAWSPKLEWVSDSFANLWVWQEAGLASTCVALGFDPSRVLVVLYCGLGPPDPKGTLESAINEYMNHGKKIKDAEKVLPPSSTTVRGLRGGVCFEILAELSPKVAELLGEVPEGREKDGILKHLVAMSVFLDLKHDLPMKYENWRTAQARADCTFERVET
jgi:hypothetical protein